MGHSKYWISNRCNWHTQHGNLAEKTCTVFGVEEGRMACLPVNCAGAKQAIGSPTYCLVETTTVNNIKRMTENLRERRSYRSSSLWNRNWRTLAMASRKPATILQVKKKKRKWSDVCELRDEDNADGIWGNASFDPTSINNWSGTRERLLEQRPYSFFYSPSEVELEAKSELNHALFWYAPSRHLTFPISSDRSNQ